MKRQVLMSLALATIVFTPAFAQNSPPGPAEDGTSTSATTDGGGRPGRGERGGRRGERWAKVEAVMNPQQKAQFKQIMEQSRSEARPLAQRMFALRQQMQGGSNMDEKTKAEFVSLRKQMKAHHEAVQAKLDALLTPDQKAQLEKSGGMPKFGDRMGGGESGAGGAGGPGGWSGRRHRRGGDGPPAAGADDYNSPPTPPLPPAK